MERGTALVQVESLQWPHELGERSETKASSPDEQLVHNCLAGSQDDWSALVDKYRNLVFSIPIRQGLSRDDASEIFQQVCLKLVSELPRLREVRSLAAWLIRVTTHECFHWLRQRDRHLPLNLTPVAEEATSADAISESTLTELQREQTLREAVTGLADRCQRLIRLLFFTAPAPSYEEVARILTVAKGSIGFIRMRCLERLRRHLEEKGFQ